MRILIVDDETKLSEALAKTLSKNNWITDTAADGESGLDNALTGIYDVILLDIMLPKLSGLEVLEKLRKEGIKTPVLLLTARDEVSDRIKGLDYGADDYLTKPFDIGELMARIRALARRNPEMVSDNLVSFGDISFNTTTLDLMCGERSIRLGLKESQILELLVKYGSHIISKEEILVKIWGYDTDAEYNNVEVYISFLRKKLAYLKSKTTIKTVRGVGYNLE